MEAPEMSNGQGMTKQNIYVHIYGLNVAHPKHYGRATCASDMESSQDTEFYFCLKINSIHVLWKDYRSAEGS